MTKGQNVSAKCNHLNYHTVKCQQEPRNTNNVVWKSENFCLPIYKQLVDDVFVIGGIIKIVVR